MATRRYRARHAVTAVAHRRLHAAREFSDRLPRRGAAGAIETRTWRAGSFDACRQTQNDPADRDADRAAVRRRAGRCRNAGSKLALRSGFRPDCAMDICFHETVDANVTRFVWLRQFEPGSNSAGANRLLDRLEVPATPRFPGRDSSTMSGSAANVDRLGLSELGAVTRVRLFPGPSPHACSPLQRLPRLQWNLASPEVVPDSLRSGTRADDDPSSRRHRLHRRRLVDGHRVPLLPQRHRTCKLGRLEAREETTGARERRETDSTTQPSDRPGHARPRSPKHRRTSSARSVSGRRRRPGSS